MMEGWWCGNDGFHGCLGFLMGETKMMTWQHAIGSNSLVEINPM